MLNVENPGDGFVVMNRAEEMTRLSRLTLAEGGKLLIARTAQHAQEVTFQLHLGGNRIGFQVKRLLRFPTVPDLSLEFRMNAEASVEAVPHNYMVIIKREPQRQASVRVCWDTLWNVAKGDDPGGFSLFQSRDPQDRDDILLHIWAEEPIAHPKVKGEWTYERAKAWLAQWRAKFIPDKGTITLEDTNLAGLYKGLEYAQSAGMSQVYLMPWIWRGKNEYWPIKQTTAGVNTNIFPNGEKDLKAFAASVEAKGMYLGLHWVSGGIGFEDPKYIGQHPDRRLASWGGGRLEKALDGDATTLLFKPDPGVMEPYVAERFWNTSTLFPPALSHVMGYNIIRVEDELIRFDKMEDTDGPVWKLSDCKRGFGSTQAALHPAGAESAGLIVPYNQNLIPDNWSPLLKEVAEDYASFVNRINCSHVEFDGLEIHRYYGGTGTSSPNFFMRIWIIQPSLGPALELLRQPGSNTDLLVRISQQGQIQRLSCACMTSRATPAAC